MYLCTTVLYLLNGISDGGTTSICYICILALSYIHMYLMLTKNWNFNNFEFDDQVFNKLLGDLVHILGQMIILHSTRRLLLRPRVKPGIIKNRSDIEDTTVSIFFLLKIGLDKIIYWLGIYLVDSGFYYVKKLKRLVILYSNQNFSTQPLTVFWHHITQKEGVLI